MARRRILKEEKGSVRSPRFRVPARASLSCPDNGKRADGRLVDLSCHGALISISSVFRIGTPVMLHFEITVDRETRPVSVPGVVTRLSRLGTALEFRNIPEDAAELLLQFSMHRLFGGP